MLRRFGLQQSLLTAHGRMPGAFARCLLLCGACSLSGQVYGRAEPLQTAFFTGSCRQHSSPQECLPRVAHNGACAAKSESDVYGCRSLILLLELLQMMAPHRLRQVQPPLSMASGSKRRPAKVVALTQLLYHQSELVLLNFELSVGHTATRTKPTTTTLLLIFKIVAAPLECQKWRETGTTAAIAWPR